MNKPLVAIQDNGRTGILFRFLCPNDVPQVKQLCRDWFPIEYPDGWYEDIASNKKFFALAALAGQEIIGLVVTEIKPQSKCNREDQGLLAYQFSKSTCVAYILTLGVVKQYRRRGIASLLLDQLVLHLTTDCTTKECKAIYLHVLTTNTVAISFYERRSFTRHLYLPLYYSINGSAKDGYSYVLYTNGGQPPWTWSFPFLEVLNDLLSICSLSVNSVAAFFAASTDFCGATFRRLVIPTRSPFRWLRSKCNRFVGSASRVVFGAPHPQKYRHLANA